MHAANLSPVPPAGRTQSGWDLFLVFAAANIVATTLQVGASLGAGLSPGRLFLAVGIGSVVGAALVAALAGGLRLRAVDGRGPRRARSHWRAPVAAVLFSRTSPGSL
jgi:hypothetical protein